MARTASSDVPESAATSGPIRSSASRSAFASSGESRAGWRKSSPYSSFSIATIVPSLDQLRVDRVAAAAEADEVEQLEVLLERLGHEPVARGQRHGGNARARLVAAGVEQVGHQRLQHGEALGGDGALAAASGRLGRALDERRSARRAAAAAPSCAAGDAIEAGRHLVDELGRPERHGLAVEVEQPAREQAGVGERRLEDERAVVLVGGGAVAARGALDEPGGGGRARGSSRSRRVSPSCHGARSRHCGRVELGRDAEVALAARREADVAADAREPEGADRVAIVVASDEVPLALAQEQAVGVHRARRLLVGRDRPVREDDRALLRDGRLDLLQPLRDLGGEAVAEQAAG